MVRRFSASKAQDFHFLIFLDAEVFGDQIARCPNEEAAFARAEEIGIELSARGVRNIEVYVLDQQQIFVGAFNAQEQAAAA